MSNELLALCVAVGLPGMGVLVSWWDERKGAQR